MSCVGKRTLFATPGASYQTVCLTNLAQFSVGTPTRPSVLCHQANVFSESAGDFELDRNLHRSNPFDVLPFDEDRKREAAHKESQRWTAQAERDPRVGHSDRPSYWLWLHPNCRRTPKIGNQEEQSADRAQHSQRERHPARTGSHIRLLERVLTKAW